MAVTVSQKLINRLRSNFYGTLRTSIVPARTRIIVIYLIVFFQVEILKKKKMTKIVYSYSKVKILIPVVATGLPMKTPVAVLISD